jgi:hypothetical protein
LYLEARNKCCLMLQHFSGFKKYGRRSEGYCSREMFSCSKLRNYLLLQGGGVGDRIPRLLSHNHDPAGPEMGWDKEVMVVKCFYVVNSEFTCCCREAVSEIEFPDYCRIITCCCREAVLEIDFPDYCRIITTPMDLRWDGLKKL